MDKACALALELLGLTDKGYKALFLQGGASTQFLATAYNLLENKGAYLNTGTWSTKAIKEAKLLGEVVESPHRQMPILIISQRIQLYQ